MVQTDKEISVLVVDDDPGMVTTLRDILGATGYAVDVAYSGTEALERARERKPDCILMDIRMPGINGVEAFRELKRLTPESFVIFMTAYATSTLVEDARREGALEVIPKPMDLEHVIRLIAETAAKIPVLVVDDDPAFCTSLGESLAARGFDVRLAQSFDDAILLFEKEPRRVVILDMKLNGRTGLDALPIIKELNPRAIVILMTGFMELHEDMRQGLTMAASACFTKPFDIEDLILTIQEAVEHRKNGQAVTA